MQSKIDVLINVFGKPYQTALSLLSLLRYSGDHIDKIYVHQEPAYPEFDKIDNSALYSFLGQKCIRFDVPIWLGTDTTDESRLGEEKYRLSLRYQYGFEKTDKKFVLVIHNDIEVTADIVQAMLSGIGEATAIGEIGQCWWCPAGQNGLCSSEKYTDFKPAYCQLMYIYNQNMDYSKRRAHNLGLRREFQENPWPLPECRVNEWAMLVNVEKARPDTMPAGKAIPIGALIASGAKIGQNWDEDVNLDTGVQWFRGLNHAGHVFRDFPVENFIIHDRRGNVALSRQDVYLRNEIAARVKLQRQFPDEYAALFGK